MQTLVRVLIALFLTLAPGRGRRGRRVIFPHVVEELAQASDRKVHLLIIRHGLSCPNLVEKWLYKLDFGRARILDPALAGVGQWGSEQSGLEISQWLQARNLVVDATMSSVLARAIETSLLTFDKHFQYEGPVDVVPFTRELASGYSNWPRESHSEQLRELRRALDRQNRSGFIVDYHWVDGIGMLEEGNWPQFLKFLANIYIPDAIAKLGKLDGSPLTLAITTHSKLIGKYLGESCGLSGKILNNGVLHMQYTLKENQNGSENVGRHYQLEQDATAACEVVYSGVAVKDDRGKLKKMCVSDIGDVCMESIMSYAFTGRSLPGITIENEIVKLSHSLDQYDEQITQLQVDLVLFLKDLEIADVSTYAIRVLEQIDAAYEEGKTTLASLQALKCKECWAGGFPDTKKYKEKYLQQSGRQSEHADRWWQEAEPSLPPRLSQSSTISTIINAIAYGSSAYGPCVAYIYQTNLMIGIGELASHESTCNSGLKCYRDDGAIAEAGEWGVCAIPRHHPCDRNDYRQYKAWRHGCGPNTKCQRNVWFFGFSWDTCEDSEIQSSLGPPPQNSVGNGGTPASREITTTYEVSFFNAVNKLMLDFARQRGTTFDKLNGGDVGTVVHSFCRTADEKQRCASVGALVNHVCKDVCCMDTCRDFAGALPSCIVACSKD